MPRVQDKNHGLKVTGSATTKKLTPAQLAKKPKKSFTARTAESIQSLSDKIFEGQTGAKRKKTGPQTRLGSYKDKKSVYAELDEAGNTSIPKKKK